MEHTPASASSDQAADPPAGEPAGHWCHECNIVIAADADLICPRCNGGFVEAMDSASTLASMRRAVRRDRRRRQRPAHGLRLADDVATEGDWGDASPQQVVRFLRFLSQNFRNSPPPLSSSRSSETIPSDRTYDSYESDGHDSFLDRHGTRGSDSSLVSLRRMAVSFSQRWDDTVNGRLLGRDDDVSADEAVVENIEGSVAVIGDEDEEDVEDEGEEGSDSEVEAGLSELSDWESFDEEDEEGWEEVELNDADLAVRFLEAAGDGDGGEANLTDREQNVDTRGALGEVADGNALVENNHSQSQTVLPRSLRRRLQAIRRGLDTGLLLEDYDTYIGNPSDYVDARGFEELLQQLIDTDSTRRGAPPAAKAAIERLCSVKIKQENLENGSALCAICKDVVALDEPAKQLPCLHLYHSACILPWLSARNSCPLCRYQLPTDDPDYEEQRKGQTASQLVDDTSNASGNTTRSDESGGDLTVAEGNTGDEATQTDSADLLVEKEKEEGDLLQQMGEGGDDSEGSALRNSLGETLTGSLFSLVGLVLLSCLGSIFMGGNFQVQARIPLGNDVRNAQSNKPWWSRFFG